MNPRSTPESCGYRIEFGPNPPSQQLEWNKLEKCIDWQHNLPELPPQEASNSYPDTTFIHDYPNSQLPEHSYILRSQVPRAAQAAADNMSSMHCISPPHSMSEDFSLNSEDYTPQVRSDPTPNQAYSGPQMPKIGRPRSITTSEIDVEGQPLTQARRRSQNREAQRAFRARQKQYIDELADENRELVARNKELEARCEMLAKAYEKILNNSNPEFAGLGSGHDGRDLNHSGSVSLGVPWDLARSNSMKGVQ